MKNKYHFFLAICFVFFLFHSDFSFSQIIRIESEECTIGVATGNATSDGRPMVWKTRDNSDAPNNVVKYYSNLKYSFICVSTAGSTLSWMGVNEHGFAIVNSLSLDLATNIMGPGNGTLMRDVLGNCKTVAEFQAYLDSTNITGRSTNSNFGVIDTTGAAAIFETGGNFYYRFDASNTPDEYIIRTNFSVTGGGTSGTLRYNRANTLVDEFLLGDTLNHKSIIRYKMRDFSDFSNNQVSVPFFDTWAAGIPYGYIYTDVSISRYSSVSTAVIHGVLPSETGNLSTMWVMLGQPSATIALPYWPVGITPSEADGNPTAPLSDKAIEISNLLFDYPGSNMYIDSWKLINDQGEGLWPCLFPIEDQILIETEVFLDSIRQLITLPINVLLNKEANLCAFALSQLDFCKSEITTTNEIASNYQIFIYPNPVSEILYIQLKTNTFDHQNLMYQLCDLNSIIKESGFIHFENTDISIQHFPSGIYLLRIIDNGKTLGVYKIVKI